MYENNQAFVTGALSSIEFSHEVFGEKFYTAKVETTRRNGVLDFVPIIISERLFDVTDNYEGKIIRIAGSFRSFNKYEGGKSHVQLFVFISDLEFLETVPEEITNHENNHVMLNGYICKEPIYRKTPLGKYVADIIVAVNRPYGKSDYIPCICWGDDAKFAAELNVGDQVVINGRIQSRYYIKTLSECETEKRIAYEVSVYDIKKNEEGDKSTSICY